MINSDLIMVRGDSRTKMDFRGILLMFVSCSRVTAHRWALQPLFWLSFATYALERSHLILCPAIRRFLFLHSVTEKLLYKHDLGGNLWWFLLHSFPHTSLNRIHIILTSFVRHGNSFFYVMCIWRLWHLSNLSWNTNVWLISHPCDKHIIMCSKALTILSQEKKLHIFRQFQRKSLLVQTLSWCG